MEFTNEGIHGLNHSRATPLPAPIAIGSTWNRALVHRAGEIAGHEARVLGYKNVYAPILDVARDPRWGRVVECYGEDPFLIAELGVEMVRGIQSQASPRHSNTMRLTASPRAAATATAAPTPTSPRANSTRCISTRSAA